MIAKWIAHIQLAGFRSLLRWEYLNWRMRQALNRMDRHHERLFRILGMQPNDC